MKNTETKPSNPYAFPVTETKDTESLELGMTLRDYFANSSMQGIFANSKLQESFAKLENPYEFIAQESYKLADAMLKQREL